ncbi:MAG TPA: ceramidase domain-containing protein [Methyloceanibacter sp.]|nr:ceramidase domain-containing protein [Methyloceanibacter sp.]
MTFGEHVFRYCERGASDALLAEPLNALSNIAFLVAALIGLQLVLWRRPEERSPDQFLLCGLVFLVGLGSLAFHVFATQGAELLDVIPISVFMLVYLGFALNRFLGVPPGFMVLLVIGFTTIMALTMQVKCWEGGIGIPGPELQGVKPCLNGSIFYLPALIALVVVGLLADEREHRAAPYLLWAAAILTVSITLRSLDFALCDRIEISGRKVGTHFAWHILNAIALFLMLRASLEGAPSLSPARIAAPIDEPGAAQAEPAVETPPAEASPPKPLAERVAPADEEAAKEDEAPEEEGERKVFFPA